MQQQNHVNEVHRGDDFVRSQSSKARRVSGGAKYLLGVIESRTTELNTYKRELKTLRSENSDLQFKVQEKQAVIESLTQKLKAYETSGILPMGRSFANG